MMPEFIYSGTVKEFANFVSANISTIAESCNWSEISNVENSYTIQSGKFDVEEIRIYHTDGTITYLFCQVSNIGLPFNALFASQILHQAAAGDCLSCTEGRCVIVSPYIDEDFASAISNVKYPANLLMLSPDKCKYWSAKVYMRFKHRINYKGRKFTKLTKIY